MSGDALPPKGLERVFLLPGELCVCHGPMFLATLLGSCVAVCLRNKHNGMSAMNHFLRDRIQDRKEPAGKFGDASTAYIVREMLREDPQPAHIEAKVYGGGAVVGHLGMGMGIGEDNIKVALEILERAKVPVVYKDVGGKHGRKVYFNTETFNVEIRPIGMRHKDYSGRKIRVLIVDDAPLVRKMLRDVIETSHEFEVCGEAGDAFEARDKILELDPDVLSLDIIMPRLDGLDFLEKIMKFKPMPVVIVSTIAKVGSPIEARAKKLGAICVIDKDSLEIYKGHQKATLVYLPALKSASMSIVK